MTANMIKSNLEKRELYVFWLKVPDISHFIHTQQAGKEDRSQGEAVSPQTLSQDKRFPPLGDLGIFVTAMRKVVTRIQSPL